MEDNPFDGLSRHAEQPGDPCQKLGRARQLPPACRQRHDSRCEETLAGHHEDCRRDPQTSGNRRKGEGGTEGDED